LGIKAHRPYKKAVDHGLMVGQQQDVAVVPNVTAPDHRRPIKNAKQRQEYCHHDIYDYVAHEWQKELEETASAGRLYLAPTGTVGR
jgi:hypothetical protein